MPKQPFVVAPYELTPAQRVRIAVALAIYEAECAALDEGMSLTEVRSQHWLVLVEADEVGSPPAPPR